MDITAKLEGFKETWRSRVDIVDLKLTIGQQDKSSTVSVVLADLDKTTAATLINHSLSNGGLAPLEAPETAKADIVPEGFVDTSGTTGGQSALRKAFLDVIAYAEGTSGKGDNGYNVLFGIDKFFSSYADHPRVRHSFGNTYTTAAGRYQFIDTTWDSFAKKLKLKDFSPANQDKAAIGLLDEVEALGDIDAGRFEVAIAKASSKWASLPGSRSGQRQKPMTELKDIHQKALKGSNVTPSVSQATKADPVKSEDSQAMVKGNKLTITIAETSFEFYHQGTEITSDCKTTVTGQGIRYVLGRRKRNKTIGQTTLKQLATAIATAHKVKLDYQAPLDISYTYLDQSGISDYELLLRECRQAGLFVSEQNGTLTIKALSNIRDSQYVLAEGLNLISWAIKDEAIDSSKDDEGSALLQGEDKVSLNPITGQFEQSKPDIDSVKDSSVTGKAEKAVVGKTDPGQASVTDLNRAKVKRVKGLPSSFVVPLTSATLGLKPLDAVRTTGLPGVLSRVWLIDSVTHEVARGTTTLSCYSPIEVLDTSPDTVGATEAVNSVNDTTDASRITPSSGFILPLHGTFTSPYGMRKGRMHQGVDISSVAGTGAGGSIVAAANGIVVFSGAMGGYGLTVDIKHPSGHKTRYAHQSTIKARLGAEVKQGDVIGIEGNTGKSRGTHLHFEIFRPNSGSRDNPVDHLPALRGNLGRRV